MKNESCFRTAKSAWLDAEFNADSEYISVFGKYFWIKNRRFDTRSLSYKRLKEGRVKISKGIFHGKK